MNEEIRERKAPFEEVPIAVKAFSFLGIFCASIVFFSLLGGKIGEMITGEGLNLSRLSDSSVVLSLKIAQAISVLGFIVPAIGYAFLASRKPFEYLKINKPGKLSSFLLGGLAMMLALPVINYLTEINSHLQLPQSMQSIQALIKASQDEADKITEAFTRNQDFLGLLGNLFVMALLAAFAEELFFRAAIQRMLINVTKNAHVGIWITAIIFSAIHFEFFGFLPRMLMGAYLGYLFVWSKSIWVPIFAHFVNNATVVLVDFLEQKKLIPDKVEQFANNSIPIGYTIASALLVAICMFFMYRIESRKKEVQVN